MKPQKQLSIQIKSLLAHIEVTLNLFQLNNRPRKTLEFKTPAEMMEKHMLGLAVNRNDPLRSRSVLILLLV